MLRILPALGLVMILGCAVGQLTPVASNQPIARQSLHPEYRVFYDALADYGDWILIEPAGFVFRPRVTWNQWRPFEYGFWAPTDTWGWVWISAEPFGWATYHYGQWFFDSFQGWVWEPGVEWMPGSARWFLAGDYVGWGPLSTRTGMGGGDFGNPVTNTGISFAPLAQLGSTDLRAHLVTPEQMGAAYRDAKPVRNLDRVEGVTINRCPPIEMVEERRGPLTRARIEDLVPVDLGRQVAGAPTRRIGGALGRDPGDSLAVADREAIDRTRRAGERAATDARSLLATPRSSPGVLPLVRPLFGSRREPLRPRPEPDRPDPAAADSSR